MGKDPIGEPEEYDLETDVLVVGGGMSGLTAGARAAAAGASVIVVEKSAETGGSAALALGFFWTAKTVDDLLRENPGADTDLAHLLVSRYDGALDWIRQYGIEVRERIDLDSVMGFPSHGHLFDNLGYLSKCATVIAANGGHVVRHADVDGLIMREGAVRGAVVTDRDGSTTIRARSVILATGGFQGDPDLRKKYVAPNGDRILLRANPNSVGDGLRLALSAGAGTSPHMNGFYGHLIPAPLPGGLAVADYARLSMMFSPRCILLDTSGARWMDESRGYFVNAQEVARLPRQRALLVGDQQVRDDDGLAFGNSERSDRIDNAVASGARVAVCDTLDALQDEVREWGYQNVPVAISSFNSQMDGDTGSVPRSRFHRSLCKPPYFAVEVQPTITFTHGGIAIDPSGHVLDENRTPIDGLLAAGVDSGGTFNGGYAGGLALATVTGLAAAESALSVTSTPLG